MEQTDKIRGIPPRLFVTGIGTDVGKSYATGWLAREMRQAGMNVITQKFIQTGNSGYSEDIERHRRIMGIGMQTADLTHLTAPLILSYPASPHLAAALDKVDLDFDIASKATDTLSESYDHVLIEGAGGVMVPLTEDYLTIDYIREHNLPAAVVTTGQLGSINHTLMTLQVLKDSDVNIFAVIYNPYFDRDDVIAADTRRYLRHWIATRAAGTHFLEMPSL